MNEELIEKSQKRIDYYKKMLEEMPKNTFLGQLCIKAYIRREERKIKNLTNKN